MRSSLAPALALLLAACSGGGGSSDRIEDPRALHDDLFVMDLHVDSVLFTTLYGTDFSEAHPPPQGLEYFVKPQADLPGLRAGGIDALWFGIVVFPLCDPPACFADALHTIETAKQVIRENGDSMELATSTDDVERIRRGGKIPTLLGMEGAHGVGETYTNVDELYRQGLRYIGLAHFTPNRYAMTNVLSAIPGAGLSDEGRRLIRRMNELGMLIDVAHTHPDSIRDAIAESRAPVFVSHTGLRGEFDTFRNLGDDEMVAIAERGGTIGVFFASLWLAPDNQSTIDTVVDHIDHVVRTVGIDHVSIGSDFDGFVKLPDDLPSAAALPSLTEALVARGYGRHDLAKLYGENFMRVFRETERVARELAREQALNPARARAAGRDPGLAGSAERW